MEKKLEPVQNLKEQFAAGPQEVPQMTPEQIQEKMEEQLPWLRVQNEYSKLQMEIMERDVLLGRRTPNSVPGIFGLELMIREIQAKSYLGNVKSEVEKMQEELDRKKQKETIETAESDKKKSK